MGKNLEQGSSPASIRSSSPNAGCMWGVLHILKYHHWGHIKKRLPHRRGANGQHAADAGEDGNPGHDVNALKADGISQQDNAGKDSCKVDEKTPASKGSVKSRLKSLISEELYKKKGKHRQNRSYPNRSNTVRKDSNNQEESSAAVATKDNESPKIADNKNSSPTDLQDPLVSNSFEEKSSEDSGNDLRPNQNDETENQSTENQSLNAESSGSKEQNLVDMDASSCESSGSKEQNLVNMDASSCKSKEILDARDMINVNKEFLLKILKDPGSPLAHHFHSQRASTSQGLYSKSMSFSSGGSSHLRNSLPKKLNQKQEDVESDAVKPKSKEYIRSHSMPSIAAEYRIDRILKVNQAKTENTDNSSSDSAQLLKNPITKNRFKDLKHKIKYAIRQSKNEKFRITRDAILHKIPHGHRILKDLKCQSMSKANKESPSNKEGDHALPSTCKNEMRGIRRTASLIGSLDKYCQLYECTFNRETKQPCSESLKLRTEDASPPKMDEPKSLRRMFSSPDLKSKFYFSEDSFDAFSSSQIICDIHQNLESETNSVNGAQLEMATVSNTNQDGKLGLVSDDLANLVTMDRAFPDEQDIGPPNKLIIEELAEANKLVLVPDSKFQEDTVGPASFSISEEEEEEEEEEDLKQRISPPLPDKIDSLEDGVAENGTEQIKFPSNYKLLEFHVGAKEKAEFDYVKDILELSGFSGNELLGTWHSNDQPVDPGLYEEVEEGCMLFDPECSGNEEGYHCNHLLLFDLINEVLMEVYAKSYTYCPMPLSMLSQIRPMPVGYHVLEEVWANVSWYLSSTSVSDNLLDYIVSRDLAQSDGWMNLQFDCECVGLEVEDLIFDELLDEMVFDDLAYYT